MFIDATGMKLVPSPFMAKEKNVSPLRGFTPVDLGSMLTEVQ